MKVKLFGSGNRDARYSTLRIPNALADKYSLRDCEVEIIDADEISGLIIKRAK